MGNEKEWTLINGKVTRRTFLKSATVAGAATTLFGCSKNDNDPNGGVINNYVTDVVKVPETKATTVCRPNCFSACYQEATIRNGKIVKFSKKALPDRSYDRICLRGLSQMHRLYSPTRLAYPLKRSENSERGNPVWERISWSDAAKFIAQGFRDAKAVHPNAIALITGSSNYAIVQKSGISKLHTLLESTPIVAGLDWGYATGFQRAMGTTITYPFMQGNEITDYRNAKTIIGWSSNVTEAQLQSWHFMCDAMENNDAKFIQIDSMFSLSAARADKFIHMRPGTDTLLALSVLDEVMKNDDRGSSDCWVDYDYMEKNTVGPFLVDLAGKASAKDKRFLRFGELTSAEKLLIENGTDVGIVTPPSPLPGNYAGASDSFIVQCASGVNAGKFYATIPDAALANKQIIPSAALPCTFGTGVNIVFGTRSVKSSYQLLKERCAENDATKTSEKTGIDPLVTKELAKIYATNKPVLLSAGFGADHYTNGHHFYHAVTALAAITGQIGKSGCGVGIFWKLGAGANSGAISTPAGFTAANPPRSIAWQVLPTVCNVEGASAPDAYGNGGPDEFFRGSPNPIRAIWFAWTNPLNTYTGTTDLKKMLTAKGADGKYKIKMVATADYDMTDTAQYCDIVLPLSHWFEQADITVTGHIPYITYQPKAVEAYAESKSDLEISKLLAAELGFSQYYNYSEEQLEAMSFNTTAQDNYWKTITGISIPEKTKVTIDELKRDGAVRVFPGDKATPYIYPAHRRKATYGDTTNDDMVFGTQSLTSSCGSRRLEFYTDSIWCITNWGQNTNTTAPTSIYKATDIDPDLEYLPNYEDPMENKPGNADYPFQLLSERQRWRVHSQWFNVPWLKEFDSFPTIKISTQDAEAKGIVTGNTVRVWNSRGHCYAKAIVSIGIRPGVVNVPRGWHISQFKEHFGDMPDGGGDSQSLTSRAPHVVNSGQAFYDAVVNIQKA